MKIAVVGLGYVELPLSLKFARSCVSVLGIDIAPKKVELLNNGQSYIKHIEASAIAELLGSGKFSAANEQNKVKQIPKGVGGYTPACLEKAMALYGRAIDTLMPVSSCRAAEATKVLENIFRSVNIALVNELRLVYTAMGIDIWEVIESAKTKPFGFMPFLNLRQ